MVTPAKRFQGWIDSLAAAWKDRLRGWMASWVTRGVNEFLESAEPSTKDLMRDSLTKMLDSPGMTPELRKAIESSIERGDWVATLFGYLGMVIGSIIGIMALGESPGRVQSYAVDRIVQSMRLDPLSIITAWRRDPETYANLFDDLRDQGWNDKRIDALKFFTLFYPAPADLIRWQAREVFEPEMIARYGLDSEFEAIEKEPFYKAGMTDEQILNYWRAHWEHASWIQVVEMLRRGQLKEEDVWDWFRVVEIPPFWRQKLINISWEVPTRVDVRRFWDMRTIDESRLREIYTHHGYHGKDLDDYVLWTKVYVAFPDLMTRYKNGWLTIEDVRSELVGLGMPPDRVEEMIQTKVKAVASENMAKQRDLTMSQIVKGVKKAVITRVEGATLLQDMGYDPYEAEYILAIEIPQDEVVTEVRIRELTKADVLAGLKSGIIFRDEARAKLLGLRYTPADVEFLLKIYDAQVKPPVEPKLKEASKADIVLGVKRGLITEYEGYIMLLDLDFSPEAAHFILMVKAEESPFSPMSYNEFKELTDKWKVTAGLEAKPMPEELKKAAAKVVRLNREVEALKRAIDEEKRGLVEEEVLPEEATERLTSLQVTLHRSEAELARVKADYDSLLAEYRYRG